MKKRHILAAFLGISLALPGIAFAKRGPNHEKRSEHLTKKLGLSAEQQEKIKAMHEAEKETLDAKMKDHEAAETAFRDAMAKPDSTPEQLTTLHDKVIASQADMQRSHFTNMLSLRGILTPEQLKKFGEMSPFKGGRRGGRGGRDGMCGWGPRGGGDDEK